jgi:hypothetical protein
MTNKFLSKGTSFRPELGSPYYQNSTDHISLDEGIRWYSWYILAPVDRGSATSTPRNSCSFGRKIIIKTGICSLRLGKYKNTYFLEILDYCGGITRKSCNPYKKQGLKHTSYTSVIRKKKVKDKKRADRLYIR